MVVSMHVPSILTWIHPSLHPYGQASTGRHAHRPADRRAHIQTNRHTHGLADTSRHACMSIVVYISVNMMMKYIYEGFFFTSLFYMSSV